MYKNRLEFMPQDGHKNFLHRVTIWYLAVGCGVHIPATVSQPTLLASLAGNLHAYSFMQLVLSQHGRPTRFHRQNSTGWESFKGKQGVLCTFSLDPSNLVAIFYP